MPLKHSYKQTDIRKFWERLGDAAAQESMKQYLPARYKTMNDSSGYVLNNSTSESEQDNKIARPNILDDDNDSDGNDDHIDLVNNVYTPQRAGNASFF